MELPRESLQVSRRARVPQGRPPIHGRPAVRIIARRPPPPGHSRACRPLCQAVYKKKIGAGWIKLHLPLQLMAVGCMLCAALVMVFSIDAIDGTHMNNAKTVTARGRRPGHQLPRSRARRGHARRRRHQLEL